MTSQNAPDTEETDQTDIDWWGHVLASLARSVTSSAGNAKTVMHLHDAGGGHYVMMSEDHYSALVAAAAPEVPTPQDPTSPARSISSRRLPVSLTPRERQILQMVADGCSGAVIAQSLGVAVNTVAQHLVAVRRKYGVTSSAAAAALARQTGQLT